MGVVQHATPLFTMSQEQEIHTLPQSAMKSTTSQCCQIYFNNWRPIFAKLHTYFMQEKKPINSKILVQNGILLIMQ